MKSSLANWNPFIDSIKQGKPLLLDGAMGSYLQQKGFETDDILWTTNINFTNPEAVIKIHSEYIESGADIITTNTFRTNPTALDATGLTNYEIYVKQAVLLAQEASTNHNIQIAGSNAPAEDCYQIERTLNSEKLKINHNKHIDLLIDNSVDFILNETQSHFDEIQIICDHCEKNNIPYAISLYFNESLSILSGESIEFILSFLKDYNPLAVGFNCIQPMLLTKLIGSIALPVSWGYYLNCGSGNPTDHIIECGISPNDYHTVVKNLMKYNPAFVGSCCGSNPAHTKKIRDYLDGKTSS